MSKFTKQYAAIGLGVLPDTMDPRDKGDMIFRSACLKQGLDPDAGPKVDHLPESFRTFPVAVFKLQVIREALTAQRKADWNSRRERKYGSWFFMNKPGFRFYVTYFVNTYTHATGGSRLCTFSSEDEEFFANECIAIWADFCDGQLPV